MGVANGCCLHRPETMTTNPRCPPPSWTSLTTTLFFASRESGSFFSACISVIVSVSSSLFREEGVQKFTGKTDPVEVLRALQKQKEAFKKPKERLPPLAMLALEWGLLRPRDPVPELLKNWGCDTSLESLLRAGLSFSTTNVLMRTWIFILFFKKTDIFLAEHDLEGRKAECPHISVVKISVVYFFMKCHFKVYPRRKKPWWSTTFHFNPLYNLSSIVRSFNNVNSESCAHFKWSTENLQE